MPKEPEDLPDLDELEPLEELPELEELEELEILEEVSEPSSKEEAGSKEGAGKKPAAKPAAMKARPAPAKAGAARRTGDSSKGRAAARPAGKSSGGGSSPLQPQRPTKKPGEVRELEQAPLLLRKAALIVGVGALFPFFTALSEEFPISWGPLMGSKALALLAGVIFHQGYMATHGGKPHDLIAKLAGVHRSLPAILSGLIAIGAVAVAWKCQAVGLALGEVATLLLASATFSHIWGYEHGGKFNPLFPLMFLGPAIAGVLNVIGAAAAFGVEDHPGNPALGLVGSLIVGAGGMLAIYTMYVAMKQAKIEGDIKREQMRQYRKAQREAQRAERAGKGAQGAGSGQGKPGQGKS